MLARHWNVRRTQIVVLAAALLTAGWLGASASAAAGLDKLDASLKLIPEDAAFYSSMMRNREQFEAIRRSNAWAKIEKMPVVQMAFQMYQAQLGAEGSPPAQIEAALNNPETRKIIDLLADMVSEEIFVYGDESCTDFLKLFQRVNAAQSYGPMAMQASGQDEGRHPGQLKAAAVLSALAQNADLIAVPNLLVGFKLKNANLAKEQLIKLEAIGNILLESNEQTKGRFQKTKVGANEYLVLKLDGAMIPWDNVLLEKLQEAELSPGDAQKVIDRLKAAKLLVALGLHDDYLVCSIGSSLQCLEKLGQGKRLIDRPELKPLEQYVDKPLTSIGYANEKLNRAANDQAGNVNELLKLVDGALSQAGLPDELAGRIRKDAAELAESAKKLFPQAGAAMMLSFLTDKGLEGYQYNWGERGMIDGSKHLTLLDHVGGNPLLAVVSRSKVNVADYDAAIQWVKRAYAYVEEFAMPAMPEEEREKTQQFLDGAMPLLARLDKANREMLLPALADGQMALVVDGKLSSKQFVAAMPEMDKPMPMVEPALVWGVSDAKLLKQAMGEYREVINGLIDVLRQLDGAEVPDEMQIPELQATQSASGAIYAIPVPEELGLDAKIAPNFALSDGVAVLSLSRDHSERLLKSMPLSADGLFERVARPRAMVVWFDWAALVRASAPWVEYALDQIASEKDMSADQKAAIAQQVQTVLEVLQALRSITSESYFDGDATVTHTLLEIRDVEK